MSPAVEARLLQKVNLRAKKRGPRMESGGPNVCEGFPSRVPLSFLPRPLFFLRLALSPPSPPSLSSQKTLSLKITKTILFETLQYFGASASCVSTFKQLAFAAAAAASEPPSLPGAAAAPAAAPRQLRAAAAAAAAFALPAVASAAPSSSFHPTAAILHRAEAAMASVPVVLRQQQQQQQQQQSRPGANRQHQQMRHSSSASLAPRSSWREASRPVAGQE